MTPLTDTLTDSLTDSPTEVRFPADFVWGAATAAYQIEGAVAADGRTPSIWDTFCRVPGAVVAGDTGDVACDHYHRMPEDVALLRRLGLDSYRFSVAWPRVRPDGGAVNPAGLAFYDRLVDELLAHDISPWLTLYHWDLPQALQDRGGWAVRETAERFCEYAVTVRDALGDRVPTWTTLNEPMCSSLLGHAAGEHAPGIQDPATALRTVHHLLLGHGLAASELRAGGAQQVGITLNLTVADTLDPTDPVDIDAARRIDGVHNRIFLDPVLEGRYPEDVLADTAHLGWTDVVRDGDLEIMSAPIDVLGVNYYNGVRVSGHGPGTAGPSPFVGAERVTFTPAPLPTTDMGWVIQPEGLTRLLVRLHEDYPGTPVVITENGAAFPDRILGDGGAGGHIDDADRIAFLDGHLRAVHAALGAGVDVRGYFVWSLMDNFEWAHGYAKRFGIVHVDYETLRRTPKASALWYASVCSEGRLPALQDRR